MVMCLALKTVFIFVYLVFGIKIVRLKIIVLFCNI
jgi:hypothetical protein